jgi:hypothetical protein
MRFLFCLLAGMLVAFSSVSAQNADKKAAADLIRKEIASLKAKLADLEKELAAIDPVAYIGPVKGAGKRGMNVGDVGVFNDDRFIVEKILTTTMDKKLIVLRHIPTGFTLVAHTKRADNLAEGSTAKLAGQWHVESVAPLRGRNLHRVEEWKDARVVSD